ncbi:MAG: Asp-tRNA(Asn)/Glu-tRNA(Gln) amidotransferase subunit GatA [Imperialibacter sp.]|uniref:Glutamyl-tRNA(Gln) amidotransferase subunit A n=1 Tax=Imperialibacter roseus TaxID=1324217 RepID=A0ABZ0IMZ3_9BACT|nr:Asp-tRNA(Asn)/Glu-tRNA(Gln) amidotransferase subunit GatA [Imperialibacter roseus]WOK05534.1 Asp-tRNA(Asn)/Glu-tRNA(Gln) amidotransferase subunit GatA [Imperialibacter roseus]
MKTYRSLAEIQKAIASGNITCKQLVEQYLQVINEKSHLNVFLEVFAEEALAKADVVDEKIRAGRQGRLAGMVISLKDVLCYKGHKLQAGSRILEGFVSQFTGTAVQRLLDEDAIIIGRTNCDEFAMGSSSENSAYGPVVNAAGEKRVPGGSSGGSAVSVQSDMCLLSLGTDTGGSVRQPASFCGIVGYKPTYSRISRYGLLAYASSFDTIGTFAHTIEDTALVLEIMAGHDDYDSTVSHEPVLPYSTLLSNNKKYKIAYLKEPLASPEISAPVKGAVEDAITWLKKDGHTVEPVEFNYLDYVLPTYYILTTAEASSNLSRYDGVKYGYRSKSHVNLETMYKKSRSEAFGKEVQRRILLGTFVLSASYYDAFYTKALKARKLIQQATRDILKEYDFIILPTSPTVAFKLGEHTKNPLEMYLADLFTVQASVAGVPAISIPYGDDDEGMPIGLQLIADAFQEEKLLAFSRHILDARNKG